MFFISDIKTGGISQYLLYFISTVFKLLGYSEPEFVTIDIKEDNAVVTYLEDLGPSFKHTYEVINLGHQTVHNAQVKIHIIIQLFSK